ncbi:jg8186 [Pararge aegeria aegeria]|uniref:Jg8186 protein n=1 Tax=Pararge aegeria aegeria TaxID=348720 RepID=A0A8S4SLB3_9NEOP|nr:jg8186 [Pararge aegeria aegeria]
MERAMLGVYLRDQIRNEEIRRTTSAIDSSASSKARKTDRRLGPKELAWRPQRQTDVVVTVDRLHQASRWEPLESGRPGLWIWELSISRGDQCVHWSPQYTSIS